MITNRQRVLNLELNQEKIELVGKIRWELYHGSSWIRLSRVESSRKTAPTKTTCIRRTMALRPRGDLLAAQEKPQTPDQDANTRDRIELRRGDRRESVLRSERRAPGSAAEEDAIGAAAVASDGEDG